jgi:hypothetical protein
MESKGLNKIQTYVGCTRPSGATLPKCGARMRWRAARPGVWIKSGHAGATRATGWAGGYVRRQVPTMGTGKMWGGV